MNEKDYKEMEQAILCSIGRTVIEECQKRGITDRKDQEEVSEKLAKRLARRISTKHARWVGYANVKDALFCTECGERFCGNEELIRHQNKFCPNCGALMTP